MNTYYPRSALQRLQDAPWRSVHTDKAMQLLKEVDSEIQLRQALASPKQLPTVLDALCALQSNCHHTYRAVLQTLCSNPRACWCLVDSLNRLPWYAGMRAFLNLPDPPQTSDCTLPFYILARNKVFVPTDMAGPTYAYHVKGLWALVETTANQQWQHLHPAGLAVIQLLHSHFQQAQTDPFVTYFAALLLGNTHSLRLSKQALRLRTQQPCHTLIRQTAALTLAHLATGRSRREALVLQA